MKRVSKRIPPILASLGCALAMAVAQDHTGDAVDKVLALENAWNQAEERKDTKALDSILDSSLVYVDYDGTLRTKSEFLARVRSPQLHPQAEVTREVTAHMRGSAVVVTGIYEMTGAEKGKPYMRRGRFLDTWTNQNGAWVCVTAQATPILH